MLSALQDPDYHFSMALWINSSRLEAYMVDDTIQDMVDVIVWEDRVEELMRVCDFYHIDLSHSDEDDQFLLGEAFANHVVIGQSVYRFHFHGENGLLYFVGDRESIFAKVKKLS